MMKFLEGIRRPWEDEAHYKARTGRGSIRYIIVPSQDGRMDPKTGEWGSDVEVYMEGQWPFTLYERQYQDRIVEIPSDCHFKNGGVNWEKVELLRDKKCRGGWKPFELFTLN